jgi:hypothetical protein
MLYLWIFGDNVGKTAWGEGVFLCFIWRGNGGNLVNFGVKRIPHYLDRGELVHCWCLGSLLLYVPHAKCARSSDLSPFLFPDQCAAVIYLGVWS